MDWTKFAPFFHPSWWNKIKPFIESKECDDLYAHLKERGRMGVKIAPSSENTWRIFKELPLNEIKVLVIGMDPYSKFINNVAIADGIAMSCSVTDKLQPTLEQWYKGIENDLYKGMCLGCKKPADLSYLVKQGVFLGNAAYTVEKDSSGSHISLWEPFQKYFFEEIVSYTGIPVIFLGNEAYKLEKYITSPFTPIFKLSHPVSASYNKKEWDANGVFKEVNKVIWANNRFKINWIPSYTEEEPIEIEDSLF